jgi:hypothetical protein
MDLSGKLNASNCVDVFGLDDEIETAAVCRLPSILYFDGLPKPYVVEFWTVNSSSVGNVMINVFGTVMPPANVTGLSTSVLYPLVTPSAPNTIGVTLTPSANTAIES